ncbi:MaoC family dehydratase [Nocardioides hungaricus]
MRLDGPLADDFTIGQPLEVAPSITIDEGLAAAYQGITGDSMRLPLSAVDSAAVTARLRRLANPGLVLQVAIGQSTVATRRVIANLFYRDVALHRQVHLGDTLTTRVTPAALELTKAGPRARRGKVLLRMETVDQDDRTVAQFSRLALIPCRDPDQVVEAGTVGAAEADRPLWEYLRFVPSSWDFSLFPTTYPGRNGATRDPLSDTVSSALELVRLTQNQAAAHRDSGLGIDGRRLVYGGHAIGLAQASLARLVPGLITVLGWRSCDHLSPVFEGDTLDFSVEEVDRHPVDEHASVIGFQVVVAARASTANARALPADVLDWRPVVLVKTARNDVQEAD